MRGVLVPLGWPRLDQGISRAVFRLLSPIWTLGVRPRMLARTLLVLSAVILLMGLYRAIRISDDFGHAGVYLALGAVTLAILVAVALAQTIPKWDRANEQFATVRGMRMETILSLRCISVFRISCLGAWIGTLLSQSWAVSVGGDPLTLLLPVSLLLALIGLHAITVIGHPPRSLQRRLFDRWPKVERTPTNSLAV